MAQSGLDSLLEALRQSGMNTDGVGSGIVNTYGLPIEMRMNIPVHERIKI